MHIFTIRKSGRGSFMSIFPKHRSFHKSKKGGALIAPQIFQDPSVSYGGQLPLLKEKPYMEALQKDLQKLQPKSIKQKKNIRFVV